MNKISDTLSLEELKDLTDVRQENLISIYLPTFTAGPQTRQNPIRLKNLIRSAENQLVDLGVDPTEVGSYTREAQALISQEQFLQNLGKGLVLFIGKDFFKYYRLPIKLDEHCSISNRFYIKPLIPYITNNAKFFILEISQSKVKLMECTKYSCEDIELPNIPQNIEEALGHEIPNTTLQFHSGAEQGRRDGSPVYHGQGSMKDQDQDKVLRYLNVIDKALHSRLREETAPLILAAVDYYLPLFKQVSTYKNIFDKGIEGDPEGLNNEGVHEKALKLLKSYFTQEQKEKLTLFKNILGTDKVYDHLDNVILAAFQGRIDTLFVAKDAKQPGTFNEETGEVEVYDETLPGDVDLIDYAVVKTLNSKGKVFVVKPEKIPTGNSVGAILRY